MKLLFVATEDWFFRSHFLPLARRAVEEGYDVVLAARDSGSLADIAGIRVIDTPFSRRSLRPWDVGRSIAQLREILDAERPDVVHAIALKPIALLLLTRVATSARVFALTGRGYLAVSTAPWTGIIGWRFRRLLRRALEAPRTALLVENRADGDWVMAGRPLPSQRVVLMPGAGVDVAMFAESPEPTDGPIAVGIVSRLIRSKGIDIAVAAVTQLRVAGMDIVLRIAGEADAENPEHVSDAEIASWRAAPGVELVGRATDVPAFWADAHIACLPSRGGEGLPRSLLEASACGRPIVVSDTPGCIDFVVQGETGLVCARDDAAALATALRALADDGARRARMGKAGRARVCAGYTENHAAAQAAAAWRAALEARLKT